MTLTVRQEEFVKLYADPTSKTFGNATQSYKSAGYAQNKGSQASSCKLLATTIIKQAIKAYRDDIAPKQEISREYVIKQLQSQYHKADDANDRVNALKALHLLGLSIAMYTNKEQVDHIFKGYNMGKSIGSRDRQRKYIDSKCSNSKELAHGQNRIEAGGGGGG